MIRGDVLTGTAVSIIGEWQPAISRSTRLRLWTLVTAHQKYLLPGLLAPPVALPPLREKRVLRDGWDGEAISAGRSVIANARPADAQSHRCQTPAA